MKWKDQDGNWTDEAVMQALRRIGQANPVEAKPAEKCEEKPLNDYELAAMAI